MSWEDIVREAYRRYHAGEITLRELMATIAQWRR